MKNIFYLSIFMFAVAAMSASATVINVPDDYETIQEGIDASVDGDTVLVADGTYTGDGNRDIGFGGRGILLKSINGPDSTIIDCEGDYNNPHRGFSIGGGSTSIIDGFSVINGFAPNVNGDKFGGGIFIRNSSPIIKNCIISGNVAGYYDDPREGFGGGIFCWDSSPTIIDCRIEGNIARHEIDDEYGDIWPGFGGGIYSVGSDIIIINCVINENQAESGAGIYCDGGNPIIENNMITNNDGTSTSGRGDGVRTGEYCSPTIVNNTISGNSGSGVISENALITNNTINGNLSCGVQGFSSTISNNTIAGNSGSYRGGGIYCSGSFIQNNIIIGNLVTGSGGGIYSYNNSLISHNIISWNFADNGGGIAFFQNSTCPVINNTFFHNFANENGGGLYCNDNADPVIVNSIFWENSAVEGGPAIYNNNGSPSVSYCDIQGGWDGEGNIDVDPLFRDPESGDYHLMSLECDDPEKSPCIDAGSPAIIDSLLDCSWGLGTILSDMGAYGGGDSVMVGIKNETLDLPTQFDLSQNYPNPFNAYTLIKYSLPSASDATIEIYDILGRRVETLVQGEQQAGYHQIIWDASAISSGMYFYKIQAREFVESKKMILIK